MTAIAKVLEGLADRIERAEVLDPPAEFLSNLAYQVLNRRGIVGLVSGTQIGHSVHPLFVAIPIGAWSSAVVFDMLGDEDAARKLTGIGLLGAVPSAITGASDWSYTDAGERRIGLVHAAANWLAIGTYLGSWLARRSGRNGLGIGLSVLGGGALTVSGWLGGHLAYALGVGVDTTVFQHNQDEWTAVGAADAVLAGQPTAGDLAGVPVLLTRDAWGQVVVLADRCTHRGAPLHEGEIKDGCIICPWHQSEFALDGSVVRGPATRPQPSYEVQIRDGEIFARRADDPRGLRSEPVGL
jgi:nitrite reductase/ring-hydroxylating ferredoxin subunit/uncharacterized membrane protein